MGTFSIWHWLIVIIFILVLFGLPVLAIRKENTEQTIGRLDFLYCLLAYVGVPLVIGFLGGLAKAEFVTTPLACVFAIAMIYPVYQRFVRRARDAGMGKTIAYLSVVPLVNLVTILILLFKPSSEESRAGE